MTPRIVVAMTATHRVQYFEEVLGWWEDVEGIEDVPVIVQCEPGFPQVHALARAWSLGATVNVNPTVYGPLHNPWVAIENGFAMGADMVVVGEDDAIVSRDLLRYMKACWRMYHRRPDVLAYCAFTRWTWGGNPNAVRIEPRFAPTIWGVTRMMWETRLRDTWDHDYSSGENGFEAGWDWNITRRVIQEGEGCSFPAMSRSQHIGKHGGAHTMPSAFAEGQSNAFAGDVRLPRRRFEEDAVCRSQSRVARGSSARR